MLISCKVCEKQIADSAITCPGCGAAQDGVRSPKSFGVTLALLFFGVHRFYVGKIGTGFLFLFTLGGVGVWGLIDEIKICTKKFRDAEGRLVLPPKLGPVNFPQTLGRALLGFIGIGGIHRFYVGKYGTGILMLFTLGGWGVWTLIDIVMLCTKNFKDAEGRLVTPEN